MPHVTDDRVLESTTTTGTGALTLAGAVAGFRSFASAMSSADTCWYALWAVDANGNATGDYEEGLGTYSTTLIRTAVLKSSNSNALVSLAAGTKYVCITALASRTLQLDNELTMQLAPVTFAVNPSAAPAGFLKFYNQNIAGRPTPRYIGPYGVDQTVQDKISENGQVLYLPNNGTTVGLNLGIGWTSGGTVSHPTPSSTTPAIYNQQKRTRWANVVTTTNQVLGLRTATAEKRYWRGNASGLGGFNFHARFAIGLWAAATVRLFVGLNDSNSGWVISDTLTGNGCGFWHDTTDAASVLSFVTRNGTTATKTSVGTLPASLAAGVTYDAWIYSPPNGSAIYYRLYDITNSALVVDSSTTTTLPLNTAFLGPELAMSNGTANTTVTTVAFELMSHSCQSDN